MNRRAFFKAASAALAIAAARPARAARKPNFILIFADDLGYGDLGCYGATDIATPNIDRMAAEGMRFTDFYAASSICTPSRAALMTGCYPARVGMAKGVLRPNATMGLNPDEITMAEVLKDAGYATMAIGKWHLGFVDGFRPTRQGFDEYYGLYHNLDEPEAAFFIDHGGVPRAGWGKARREGERPASRDGAKHGGRASVPRAGWRKARREGERPGRASVPRAGMEQSTACERIGRASVSRASRSGDPKKTQRPAPIHTGCLLPASEPAVALARSRRVPRRRPVPQGLGYSSPPQGR